MQTYENNETNNILQKYRTKVQILNDNFHNFDFDTNKFIYF